MENTSPYPLQLSGSLRRNSVAGSGDRPRPPVDAERRRAHRADQRARLFNLDWVTLLVMVVIAVIGAVYFLLARPDRKVAQHMHDTLEATGAER